MVAWCGRVSCAAALDNLADGHTCGDRMQWLRTDAGGAHTELSACTRVAVTEFPTTCGDCAPEAGGAEPLRAADLRPRVVQLQGCSMSTVVIHQLTHVLAIHNVRAAAPVYEPMICSQNPYCEGAQNSDEAITKALTTEVQQMQAAGQVAILKTHLDIIWAPPQFVKALKFFGAVAVEAYRSNRLDAYLCMVKDCMFSWNGWKVASYLVDPRDHARPVACNASRRDKNATEQPLVHV